MAKTLPKKSAKHNPSAGIGINFLEHFVDDKKDEVCKRLIRDFEVSRDWRQPYRDRWIENYQLYRMYSKYYENRPKWQSGVFIGIGTQMVETVHPRLTSAIYDTPPVWMAHPESPKYRKAAQMTEQLLEVRVQATGLFYEHFQTFKEMLIYGTAFQGINYVVDDTYEGTKWTATDLFDMYPDPAHSDVRDMRYLIRRHVYHVSELYELERQGIIQDLDVKKIKDRRGTNNYIAHLDRLRTIGFGNSINEMDDYHEVLEYWGKYYDRDTETEFDICAMIVDRNLFVKFDENPYRIPNETEGFYYALKPFVKFLDTPVPHETYGVSIIDMVKSLNYEINDRRNMINDAMQYALAPVYLAYEQGLDDINDITIAPGTIIKANYMGGADPIKPLQKDLGFMHGYNDMEAMKQEARDETGVQHAVSGSEGNIRKTATEALTLAQEGSLRIKPRIQMIGHSLEQQGEMTFLMERQFTDTEVLLQVFENDKVKAFAKVTPTQLEFRGAFRLHASSLHGLKALTAQQRMEFANVAMGLPGAEEIVDWRVMLKLIAEALEIKDSNLIVEEKAPEPVQPQGVPDLSVLQGGMAPGGMPGAGQIMPPAPPPPDMGMQPTMSPIDEELAALQSQIQSDIQSI
ncbi:MAG: hypothetical protein DRJ03_02665 [Chloroflexi bacterium]|nr:MAG: hypothetical protein DRJ03_02665 [Chloroflexota bacterium]